MQGDSSIHRRNATRFAGLLAVANIAMAGFFVALLYQLGTFTAGYLPRGVALGVCVVAITAAVVADARAMRTNSYSFGLSRQTSKSLARREDQAWWVTPLVWGLDTGLIWTTFRVSCTSWVLLLAAFLNVAPQWSGLVYGLFFGIPLLVAASTGDPERVGRTDRPPPLRFVQAAGLAVLVLLPLGMIASQYPS